MKTIKVVAAVICDSIKVKKRIPIPVPDEAQIREYLEFVKQSDKSK